MWMYTDTDFNKVFDFTTQKNGTVNQYIVRICEDHQPRGQWNSIEETISTLCKLGCQGNLQD